MSRAARIGYNVLRVLGVAIVGCVVLGLAGGFTDGDILGGGGEGFGAGLYGAVFLLLFAPAIALILLAIDWVASRMPSRTQQRGFAVIFCVAVVACLIIAGGDGAGYWLFTAAAVVGALAIHLPPTRSASPATVP